MVNQLRAMVRELCGKRTLGPSVTSNAAMPTVTSQFARLQTNW